MVEEPTDAKISTCKNRECWSLISRALPHYVHLMVKRDDPHSTLVGQAPDRSRAHTLTATSRLTSTSGSKLDWESIIELFFTTVRPEAAVERPGSQGLRSEAQPSFWK